MMERVNKKVNILNADRLAKSNRATKNKKTIKETENKSTRIVGFEHRRPRPTFRRRLKSTDWPNLNNIVIAANETIDETLEKMDVPTLGLTEQYIHETNKGKKKNKHRFKFFHELWKNLSEPFTLILIGIIIYNFVMYAIVKDITNLAGGGIVVFLILVSATFDISTEYSMHKSNRKIILQDREIIGCLRNVILTQNTLINSEKYTLQRVAEVDYRDLLPGDVIYLHEGDIVPVDCKIIYSKDAMVNQEVIVGSKVSISKKNFNTYIGESVFRLSNILFRGTQITGGTAWAIVLYKEKETYFEFKQSQTKSIKVRNPFTEQVGKVTRFLVMSLIIFVPMIFILAILIGGLKEGFSKADVWMDAIVFAMAIAIALAPDSLPLIMTSTFARARRRLAKQEITSRDITAVQNIGAMDIVVIDYEDIFIQKSFKVKEFVDLGLNKNEYINKIGYLSFLYSPSNNREVNDAFTKSRLVTGLKKELEHEYKYIRTVSSFAYPGVYTTIIEDKHQQRWAITRGTLSTVLGLCNEYRDLNNENKVITKDKLNPLLHDAFQAVISKSYFSIGISIKKLNDGNDYDESEVMKENYTLLGIVNLEQKTKANSIDQLAALNKAAVNVKLFSQRTLEHSLSMTKTFNFAISDYVSGPEIDNMTDREVLKKIARVNLFYDMDPLSEVRVIQLLKKQKHTVGYIGRDLNSSAQLLHATVGITTKDSDVLAKNCANMLIGNEGIEDVILAITESRKSLINVMKFVKVKTVWAISITIKLAVGLIWLKHEPINAIELLLQSLFFDFIEYMIIYDHVDNRYVNRPVKWDTKSILIFALWNGVIIQAITFANIAILGYVIEPGSINNIRVEGAGFEHQLAQIQTAYWIEDSIIHLIFILILRNHFQSWLKEKPSPILLLAIIIGAFLWIAIPFIPQMGQMFDIVKPKWPWYISFAGLVIAYEILANFWKETYIHLFHKWI